MLVAAGIAPQVAVGISLAAVTMLSSFGFFVHLIFVGVPLRRGAYHDLRSRRHHWNLDWFEAARPHNSAMDVDALCAGSDSSRDTPYRPRPG